MDQVIGLLEEVVRDDLEICEGAIRSEDQPLAISAIERAFANQHTAIDMLRSVSTRP